MGAAGDMLMASLYEICPDKEKFLKMMNEMGLPGKSSLPASSIRPFCSSVCTVEVESTPRTCSTNERDTGWL